MKKIMMTLMAVVTTMCVNAQVYVGGGIGVVNTSADNSDDVTSFVLVPEVGYSFNDDWAAGIAFGWEGTTKGGAKTFSINPYARFTVVKGSVVTAFIDGSVGYAHTYNAGFDKDAFSVGLKPGIAVNLNDNLSFVTHIGFVGYQNEKNNVTDTKVNHWGVDLDGRNIVFGLYYNF